MVGAFLSSSMAATVQLPFLFPRTPNPNSFPSYPSSQAKSSPSLIPTLFPLATPYFLCNLDPKPHFLFPISTSSAQFLPNLEQPSSASVNGPLTVDLLSLLRFSVRHRDVELATALHALVLKLEEGNKVFNALITAYLKLGQLDNAWRVFESLPYPDVVSYTALISGLSKSNRENEAIALFLEMGGSGIAPNEYSFVALLIACNRLAALELGFQVHALLIKMGYFDCVHVANSLLNLYGKCGLLDLVIELFDEMPQRDITSWNTLITSMVKESMYYRAFEFFRDMLTFDGFRVDYFTLSILLTASAGCSAMMVGKELHAHALRIGYENNLSVNNALIVFYTKCGFKVDVLTLFEKMPQKDVFTWTEMITAYMEFGLVDLAVDTFNHMPEKNSVSYNALLAGYCRNNDSSRAFALFSKMVEERLELTDFTLNSVITACGLLMEAKVSEQIHGFVLKFGVESNVCIKTALLDMCIKCGRMMDAEMMFNNWPSDQKNSMIWTSMISGFARIGQPDKALTLFNSAWSELNMGIDGIALATLLGICGTLGFHAVGEQIHCCALKYGYLSDIGVGNATISMYSKCGNMKGAVKVFNHCNRHDIVSWNCLISGHILHRNGDEALASWDMMEKGGFQPDSITCLLRISAYKYTSSNFVEQCQSFFFIHGHILSCETLLGALCSIG